MRTLLYLPAIAISCICTSCGTTSDIEAPIVLDESLNPAPIAEIAPIAEPEPTGPYAHLPQLESSELTSDTELRAGCYTGTMVLDQARLKLSGAGAEQTVIDGNLIISSRCTVSNLMVTGDVIFKGHGARLHDVTLLGQVLDYGQQNRY